MQQMRSAGSCRNAACLVQRGQLIAPHLGRTAHASGSSGRAPGGERSAVSVRQAGIRCSFAHQREHAATAAWREAHGGAAARAEDAAVPAARRRLLPLLRAAAAAALVLTAVAALVPQPSLAAPGAPTNMLSRAVDMVMHLDHYLAQIIAQHGRATYAILFGIVFCETGLVITPFLPGDSLLFAAGTFAAMGHLNLAALLATFIVAATLGDAVNYALGQFFGSKALQSRLIAPEHVQKTQKFYTKHGAKTVVLARFIPIVRTFAPFVAGVGSMQYSTFALYNVAGALLWAFLFVGAGYFFGGMPFVQHNFTVVVFAIVAISLLPVLWELWAARQEGSGGDDAAKGPQAA